MNIILTIISAVTGILIGLWIRDTQTRIITDTYTPNRSRSDLQQAQDDVMQLKNEIAQAGVIKREELPNGEVKLTIKLIK